MRQDKVINYAKLYNIILFVLVFFNVLQRNVLLSGNMLYGRITNIIEMIMYVILIYIIISKKYSTLELIVCGMLGGVLFVGYLKSGMAVYFRSLLLILASRNEKYDCILKCIMKSIIAGIIVSFVLYIIGLAPDSKYVYHYEGMGFGFGEGNVIGELICLCVMIHSYFMAKKKKKINWPFMICIIGFLYIFTTSKTATIIAMFTPVTISLLNVFFTKHKSCIFKSVVYAFNILLFVFAYYTAILYSSNTIVQKIDLILTNRVFLNSYTITKYPPVMLGQHVQLHDTGVYNAVRNIGNITVTVDNSYVLSLVSLGILPTIIFSVGYVCVIRKAFIHKDYSLIALAILLCLYGFSEARLIEIYDNFVYLSILTNCNTNFLEININDHKIKRSAVLGG